jgi:transposase InsO family protein
MRKFRVSERLACRVLGQHRSTKRKVPHGRPDEEAFTADIVALASQYGCYGYRRITTLLRDAGWVVNVKRVERIWRWEGLKVARASKGDRGFAGARAGPISLSAPHRRGVISPLRGQDRLARRASCDQSP